MVPSPTTPSPHSKNMANNLELTIRNQCAILILNRPEIRNAFDDALIANLAKTLKKLDADDSVRVPDLANGQDRGARASRQRRDGGQGVHHDAEKARGLAHGRRHVLIHHEDDAFVVWSARASEEQCGEDDEC